ncbi:hypothetical protein [Psychrobacter celer]|uniref:hypothetical protein n=1 Tax=Psychrobacter celer TaxID=306572 RepID=UPI003FD1D951
MFVIILLPIVESTLNKSDTSRYQVAQCFIMHTYYGIGALRIDMRCDRIKA